MSNILIRDVPADDLAEIRAAAAKGGTSVQRYLLDALHAQAVHLRRQAELSRLSEHLRGRAVVPDDERQAVLDQIASVSTERADQLSQPDRP